MSVSDVVCKCRATPERDSHGQALPCTRCFFGDASMRPAERIAQLEAELAAERAAHDGTREALRVSVDEFNEERAAHERTKADAEEAVVIRSRQRDLALQQRDEALRERDAAQAEADAAQAEADALRKDNEDLFAALVMSGSSVETINRNHDLATRVPQWRELQASLKTCAERGDGCLGHGVWLVDHARARKAMHALAALDKVDALRGANGGSQ